MLASLKFEDPKISPLMMTRNSIGLSHPNIRIGVKLCMKEEILGPKNLHVPYYLNTSFLNCRNPAVFVLNEEHLICGLSFDLGRIP